MEKHTYATESGAVRYWTAGPLDRGASALVFLPGLTADHALFDAQKLTFPIRIAVLRGMRQPMGNLAPTLLIFRSMTTL